MRVRSMLAGWLVLLGACGGGGGADAGRDGVAERRVVIQHQENDCTGAVLANLIVHGAAGDPDLRLSMRLDPASTSCVFPSRVIEKVPSAAGRRVEVEGRDSAGQLVFWGQSDYYTDPGSRDVVVALQRKLGGGTALVMVDTQINGEVTTLTVGPYDRGTISPRVSVGSVEQTSYSGDHLVCAAVTGLGGASETIYAWVYNGKDAVCTIQGKLPAGTGFVRPPANPPAGCTMLVPGQGTSPCHPTE